MPEAQKFELTHDELVNLVHEAVMQDRTNRDIQAAEKAVDSIDPESVSYNTNRLYIAGGKKMQQAVDNARHQLPTSRFLDDHCWKMRDGMRYLVNSAMLAQNNAYVQPGDRQRAIELYETLENVWESAFNQTVVKRVEDKEGL